MRKAILCAVLLLNCGALVFAQASGPVASPKSCQSFVQEFYDWYLPKARSLDINSLDLALRQRASVFSARLIDAVKAVEADAARERDAGLDFDWILNTQDPGDPGEPGYVARDATVSAATCRIDVYRQMSPGKVEKEVVPELEFEHGRWRFVNFHYPDSTAAENENLLSLTSAYLKSNSKPKSR